VPVSLPPSQKLKRQWIGIDISPTSCRVMAKWLQDACGMLEKEELWEIGRGFVVRDLPWTEEKLRALPPFEFENWAVIALGGMKNKAQGGYKEVDGRIFPALAMSNVREAGADELALEERWFPRVSARESRRGSFWHFCCNPGWHSQRLPFILSRTG